MIPRPFPDRALADWTQFLPQGDGSTRFQTWSKPAGCSWVFAFAVGPGGGGAGGRVGTSIAGAGGGGSGSVARMMIPAFLLPDTLFIIPQRGGLGGLANTTGTAGNSSIVSLNPDTLVPYAMLIASGGAGGVSAGGGGGGGGAASQGMFSGVGLLSATAGQAGAAGGAGVAGGSITVSTTIPITGGAAGGAIGAANTNVFNGGAVLDLLPATGPSFRMNSVPAGSGVQGSNGINHGIDPLKLFLSERPILFSGGGGTASHATLTQNAGHGAWGCGGGGVGAVFTGGVRGVGGNGGHGFVFMGAF